MIDVQITPHYRSGGRRQVSQFVFRGLSDIIGAIFLCAFTDYEYGHKIIPKTMFQPTTSSTTGLNESSMSIGNFWRLHFLSFFNKN